MAPLPVMRFLRKMPYSHAATEWREIFAAA